MFVRYAPKRSAGNKLLLGYRHLAPTEPCNTILGASVLWTSATAPKVRAD